MGYWENRQAQLMYEQMEKAEATAQEIADIYAKASRQLNYKISEIYDRYIDKHNLSEDEAKKLLSNMKDSTDISELKKAIAADPKNKDLLAELESPAYRARIERLENLQAEIDNMMKNVYNQEKKVSTDHYVDLYNNSYYHGIYDVQKMVGFQFSFSAVDPKMFDKLLASKWSGENYSTRIWNNTQGVAKELKEQMILGYLTGKKEDDMAMELANKYATGAFEARRLVRTESNFFYGQAQLDAYNECDCEKYEYVAVLDLKTSEQCRALDGQVFYLKDAAIGVNMHPMHPFCRSTTIASLDDTTIEGLKRRARNPITGKHELIPADKTYTDWYSQNVANNPKALAEEKKVKNAYTDKKQYDKYKNTIGSSAGKTFEDFQDMKYNNAEKWNENKAAYRKTNVYNKAVANEPEITEKLKGISEKLNVQMEGLENRIKTKKSFMRKVGTDTGQSLDESVIKKTLESTHDTVRYTFQDSAANLVESYGSITKELKEQGFEVTKVKNTWADKHNPYKGINATVKAPNGQLFEIQYHTPESYAVKSGKMHELYEELRTGEATAERSQEIAKEMFTLCSTIEKPTSIESIKNIR